MRKEIRILKFLGFAAIGCTMVSLATADPEMDNWPGFVCPYPNGGAWASTTSFPGCKPAANYAAAEREVSRLNAAVQVDQPTRSAFDGTNFFPEPANQPKQESAAAKTKSVFELIAPAVPAPQVVPPQPSRTSSDSIVEAGAKGAVGGILLVAFTSAFFLIRWLWRRSRAAAVQVAYIAGNTSAKDIARAAGGAAAKVERKTTGVMEAFREGRRDAEKRRD